MDKKDELLHEFTRLTAPETVAAPAFHPVSATASNGGVALAINGVSGSNLQFTVGSPPPQWPEDTLGRILRLVSPWARWYLLAWLFTMLGLMVLMVAAAFIHGGSWAGANAWIGPAWPRIGQLAAFSTGFAVLLTAYRATCRTPLRFRSRTKREAPAATDPGAQRANDRPQSPPSSNTSSKPDDGSV